MNYNNKINNLKPFIHFRESVVVNVNNQFIMLTGFSIDELIGKSIYEILKLLKADSCVNFDESKKNFICYIFSKECNPREVKISCYKNIDTNESTYFFNEIKNSRMEDNYPYLSNILPDNDIAVAIYSAPKGILLKANEKYISYLNDLCIDNSNKIGRTLSEFIPNYKGSSYENSFTTVISTGIPKYFKDYNDCAYQDGNKYWDGSLVPIYRKGKMKYIVHTGIDVTERVIGRKIIESQKNELQKQKDELEERRQELEAIIENISDEVIIFDKSGNYNLLNKATRDNAIYDVNTTNNISDLSKLNILHDMDGNLIPFENTLTNRVIRGEKIKDANVIRKRDNIIQIREVNGTPIYDSEGNFKLGVLISRDINERLKNEESILIRNQYGTLYNIINDLDLGFARVSYPDIRIIDINHKAFSILKKIIPHIKSQQSIYNQKLSDIINRNVNITENIKKIINNNSNTYYIIRKYIFDGEEVFYKYIFQPLHGLNNDILEVIIIGLDITEEQKNKFKMEEAIKIQDELYMNVSHELRTPLNVIFSANQLMEMFLKSSSLELNKERLINYNSMVKQNCYRLTKLINNIIDLSKGKTGFLKMNLSDENIVEIVRNIVLSVCEYAKQKNLSIIFNANVDKKVIACDPYLIERVMLNLISNSIKFSNPDSDIVISLVNKEDVVEILVTDTGIGMDDNTLKYLFGKYYQADKSLSRMSEGSGIGLSLAKHIVELHGGNIKVESELGKGSTFIVDLPVRIVNNQNNVREFNKNDKIEMIKIEFSDIYSNGY